MYHDMGKSDGGIFYQALPDIGPDGRNVMKLIPVQRLNGQYFPSPTSKPMRPLKPKPLKGALGSGGSVEIGKVAALSFSSHGQKVRNQETAINCLSKQLGVTEQLLDHDYTLNKKPPLIAKSLAPARGKHLHAPATTQVQIAQVCDLPTRIKKLISSAISDTNTPSVVCVPPTPATPNQSILAQKELPTTSSIPAPTLEPVIDPKPQEDVAIKYASDISAPVHTRARVPALTSLPTVETVKNHVTVLDVADQLLDHDYSLNKKPLATTTTSPAPPSREYWIQSRATRQITQTSEVAAGMKKQISSASSNSSLPIMSYVSLTGAVHRSINSPSMSADKQLLKTSNITAPTSDPMMHPKPQNTTLIKDVSCTRESEHLGKVAALTSFPAMQLVKNIVSVVKTLPKQPVTEQPLDHAYTLNKQPQVARSPLPPSRKYLLTPATRQVPLVQASESPTGIEKHISTAKSFSDSSSPGVVSLSPPPEAAHQSMDSQSVSSPDQLSKASDICIPTLGRSKPHLRLISKVPRRPNSPMKWVIEEDDVLRVSPLNSSVASAILQTLAKREHGSKNRETLISPSNLATCEKDDNSPIVCKGKLFFAVKKNNIQLACEKTDSATTVTESEEKKQDEVIDLCSEDDLDGSPQQAASTTLPEVTNPDEDNVIFVSYVPPKPESGKTQDLTQKARGKETEQKSGHPAPLGLHKGGDGSSHLTAGGSPHDHEAGGSPKLDCQQSTSTHDLESNKVHVDTQSSCNARTFDYSRGMCSRGERVAHEKKSSMELSSPPKPQHIADNLLRQAFGITSDVKICLQRINEAWIGPVEDIQETSRRCKKDSCFIQHCENSQKTDDSAQKSDKRAKTQSEQDSSEDPVTSYLHLETGPLECSPFKREVLTFLKSQCSSGQSSHKAALCDLETEPMFDYVEPLDEDLSSADESNTPNSQDSAVGTQTQNCVNPSGNTRRVGRARKRTTCPCCIAGSPAVKSIGRVEEPERWAWKAEQRIKKGRRMSTKAQRKVVKSSGGLNCVANKNKQSWQTIEIPAVSVYVQHPATVK